MVGSCAARFLQTVGDNDQRDAHTRPGLTEADL